MIMIELKIIFQEKPRRKIILVFCEETKEILIKNIEIGRMNLDKWLFD